MTLRFIGSILLIIGTSIGAGILALPMVMAELGFLYALLLLLICWLTTTCTALYLLEANLKLPVNSNMVSMARESLGLVGLCITWLSYLLLLYSLLAAYLSGGGDVIMNLFSLMNIKLSSPFSIFIFLIILSGIVYIGIHAVDLANRFLMIFKLILFFCLVTLLFHGVQINQLPLTHHFLAIFPAAMVAMTSFGFASIIPTLRQYLNSNRTQLRLAIILGSFIALICYIAWCFVMLANFSIDSLHALNQTPHAVDQLLLLLVNKFHHSWISHVAEGFTSICIMTSFLGVSIGLKDFLADGLQLEKRGKESILLYFATFLPPFILVTLIPNAFITALNYAGIFCVILLLLLPIFMAWRLRYLKSQPENEFPRSKSVLYAALAMSTIFLVIGFIWH